ncbi:MAG: DUF6602 domain-containing protein [Gemmatimonadales bacterium]|nr:DUF6602 domain-containing protein [Gemmatimonadales bacterium]
MKANQVILHAELARAGTTGDHAPTKGTMAEDAWRGFLAKHLPRRYRVSQGFVVDSVGGVSRQNDIIIHDPFYCPVFEEAGGSIFVPAESVYAVFEAKQEATKATILDAAVKAESVRNLHRTSDIMIDCGVEKAPRPLTPILAGIVALRCSWVDGIGEKFVTTVQEHTGNRFLDLGCVLDVGSFDHTGNGLSAEFVHWSGDASLSAFLVRLLARLKGLGTIPAIDWGAYSEALLPPGVTDSNTSVVSSA